MPTANLDYSQRCDLTVRKNDYLPLLITVLDQSGNDFDFTGYSCEFRIKRNENLSTNLLELTSAAGEITLSTGQIYIPFTADDLDIKCGTYFYELEVITLSGNEQCWLHGKITIRLLNPANASSTATAITIQILPTTISITLQSSIETRVLTSEETSVIPIKYYEAFVSALGVATASRDTFSTISIAKTATGTYTVTNSGGDFTSNKTTIIPEAFWDNYIVKFDHVSASSIIIRTYFGEAGLIDCPFLLTLKLYS